MKILVLGSRGLIGSSLYSELIKEGHEVHEWDITISPEHDLRISAPDTSKFDFVFFLAYDVGGSKFLSNKDIAFINNNVQIMSNVFSSLEKSGIPFVFASSEMQNLLGSSYGTMKRLGEQYTNLLNGISARFWNIYGPEKVGLRSHVIPDFIHQHKTTGSIKLLTTGTEERQFLHTDDCARALICIMTNFDRFRNDLDRRIIDIAKFEWTSIIDLARMISDDVVPGVPSDNIHVNNVEPDPFILGFWRPQIDLVDGIEQISLDL